MGFLNNLRSFMWIWVQQYTTREVSVGLFAHLHGRRGVINAESGNVHAGSFTMLALDYIRTRVEKSKLAA